MIRGHGWIGDRDGANYRNDARIRAKTASLCARMTEVRLERVDRSGESGNYEERPLGRYACIDDARVVRKIVLENKRRVRDT